MAFNVFRFRRCYGELAFYRKRPAKKRLQDCIFCHAKGVPDDGLKLLSPHPWCFHGRSEFPTSFRIFPGTEGNTVSREEYNLISTRSGNRDTMAILLPGLFTIPSRLTYWHLRHGHKPTPRQKAFIHGNPGWERYLLKALEARQHAYL